MSIPKAFPPTHRKAHVVNGPATVLVLPDVHVPFHDKQAIEIALDYGKKARATHILLNGDFVDFYALSRFDKNMARGLRLFEEMEVAKELLEHILATFPKASVIYKEGNHDERLGLYVSSKAPELTGAIDLSLRAFFGHYDRVSWVGDKRPVHLGKLPVFHGHEWKQGMQPAVNPSRWLFLRTLVSAMCGHFHQKSEHTELTANGKLITTYSLGCLCHRSPDYMPYNKWSTGFALVRVEEGNAYDVQSLKIYKGKLWQS